MTARDDLLGWTPEKEAELRDYKRREISDMRGQIETLEHRIDALETWRDNLQGRILIIGALLILILTPTVAALTAHFIGK